jgi:deoxyribodipyrimidine photolyase-like uncharacterized protein
MSMTTLPQTRNLIFICPDQLNPNGAALREADAIEDVIVMGESRSEATRFSFHIQRLSLIFSAMRHLAESLRNGGFRLGYHPVTKGGADALGDILLQAVELYRPQAIRMIRPNRYDLIEAFEQVSKVTTTPLEFPFHLGLLDVKRLLWSIFTGRCARIPVGLWKEMDQQVVPGTMTRTTEGPLEKQGPA